ncbi:hypothetical protein RCS94_10895 [Orbaceae bacterium ac157xtp]
MRSIRKSHVPTVSFRFERQIAEEGSRVATRTTAPRRGLRVAALGNPYRARKDCFCETKIHSARNHTNPTGNCALRILKESPFV